MTDAFCGSVRLDTHCTLIALISLLCAGKIYGADLGEELIHDKTLVVWASPANLTQRGGSALTVDDQASHFDGIVFGEVAPTRWMPGSDFFRRTSRNQDSWPKETVDSQGLVQIAIVYRGTNVTLFRNGREYANQAIPTEQPFSSNSVVLIGPRHVGNQVLFAGQIADARIYSRALTAEEINKLKLNDVGSIRPWAWWSFEAGAKERTGRFPHTVLSQGARVEGGRLKLDGVTGGLFAARDAGIAEKLASRFRNTPPEDAVLKYHLMHPGGASLPGDPNAAFCLDGVYHLHYILSSAYRGTQRCSYVHVTSSDMLHWTWQPTKLQPKFTGHGMFSGTGFLTKDGRPATIYHGEASGKNQIAIATDRKLSDWQQPFAFDARNADGSAATINHWDPDCFLIGDNYYAISGGENPPLLKSNDLKTWQLVGDFLQHDLPDVAKGEDISCANFFPIGKKWMLLCISHYVGCRYYIGDWDAKREQFVPERHGRMNWRREGQSLFGTESWRVDYFAPESLQTADGRRVMWAWLACADRNDGQMSDLTIQSLPRELSLADDSTLRIRPLRELDELRYDRTIAENVQLKSVDRSLLANRCPIGQKIVDLISDAMEIRITIAREEANRKLFGFTVFSDGKGSGLPIIFRPETGTLRIGTAEVPFSLADLPANEDIVLRVFIDRQLVEVFANDRQAAVAYFREYQGRPALTAFTIGAPTTLRKVESWKIHPTNEGFMEALKSRVWEPKAD